MLARLASWSHLHREPARRSRRDRTWEPRHGRSSRRLRDTVRRPAGGRRGRDGDDAEGRLVYQDTTKKDITVFVKRKETQIGGRLIGFWDVLLGDMRVKETSK